MSIADTLSRAYLKDPVEDGPELLNIVKSIAKHLAINEEKKVNLPNTPSSSSAPLLD